MQINDSNLNNAERVCVCGYFVTSGDNDARNVHSLNGDTARIEFKSYEGVTIAVVAQCNREVISLPTI